MLGDLAGSLVDPAVLEQLLAQFSLLDTAAKLKILAALAAIRRRDISDSVADQLDRLIQTAVADPEPWVKVTAQLMAPVPRRTEINDRLDEADSPLGAAVARIHAEGSRLTELHGKRPVSGGR